MASPKRNIEVKPVTSTIGAEVTGIDLRQPLAPEVFVKIHQAWLEHLVLFFPDQILSAQQLKGLLGHFGDLHETRWSRLGRAVTDPYAHILGTEYGDQSEGGGFTWRPHIDNASSRIPVKAIGLCALEVPESGADTMWINLHAAYDALSGPTQRFLEGLTGLYSGLRRDQVDDLIARGPDAWNKTRMRAPAAEHPLVRTHPETGRKALFIDALWTWSVKELHPQESVAVIAFLQQHCERAEFQVRLKWREGMVVVWDNRCTLHHKIRDPLAGERLIQRVSVDDTEPPRR